MKLYTIKHNTDPKEVGSYIQLDLDTTITPYNIHWPNSYWKIPPEGKIPFDLAISDFRLEDKAIQTDHLHSSLISSSKIFFISEVFLNIIKEFKVKEHDIFPIRILNNRTDLDYFIFHFWNRNYGDFIDWTKTIWVSYEQLPTAGEFRMLDKFTVASYEALSLKRKLLREKGRIGINLSKLYLKPDLKFDGLFYFGTQNLLLCSEEFERRINGEVSGIKIEEYYDTEIGFKEFKHFFESTV